MSFTLFDHQQQFLDKNPKKRMLVWDTGTGKTFTSLMWAQQNKLDTLLIICPKTLKTNWERSIKKFFGDTGFYPVYAIYSKEEFKKHQHLLPPFQGVIVDEAHYFSGRKSQMTKSLMAFNKRNDTEYMLLLTATPFMSTPWNAYVLALHLGVKWSYPRFFNEFFYNVPMGGRIVPMLKKDKEESLAEYLREISDIVRTEDCVDLPEQIYQTIYLNLTKSQEKSIENLKEFATIVRWTKVHQICGGTLKPSEFEQSITFASEKRDFTLDLVNRTDKTIVVCRYNNEIEMLESYLTKHQKKPVYVINGAVKDKQAVIDLAHATDECVVLVNAAVSEGWELKSCKTMLFYSYDFSLKNYIQMKGRIQRIDNIQKCMYISLVVPDTVDEAVYTNIVEKKMDFQLAIYSRERS